MNLRATFLLLFITLAASVFAQVPAYYDDVNLNLTGQNLLDELADKVTDSQTNSLSYTPGVWDALKQTDQDPTSASRVILIYGYSDTDGVTNTDRTRGINDNGGGTTDWNREHVYPKSLGTPNLGTSGPGSDAHHLRPSDVSRNSSRGNRKFADGSGNSAITSAGHWYPGDEFKGDVARMVLFMYIRYGNRCLPNNVAIGTVNSSDNNMIDLLLEWNAEDPVSSLEDQRNPIIEGLQGNRNPFIDNPAFATDIWGGPQAEDRFDSGGGNNNNLCNSTINSFPYSESYESDFGAWVQAGSDDFDWSRRSGSTPSSGTGPSSASDGSDYIYMESSTPNYSTKRAILYGPCFDLSSANQASFSFKYHLYGASNMGSLAIEASLDGTSWTSIWNRSGNQGNNWGTANIDLATYLGENVQLRLNGVTGTTWKGDMAVDDLELTTSSGGGNSQVATNLRITFDNYPEETSWAIQDANGTTVYAGGTYGSQADGSTINIPALLNPGCYTLFFYDTYGDGICCSYGNGSYALTNSQSGSTLASGGTFGSTDTKAFCVSASRPTITNSPIANSDIAESRVADFYPNPTTDKIRLLPGSATNYRIINQAGQLVQEGRVEEQLNLQGLAAGAYFISFIGPDQLITKVLIKE